MPLSMRRLYWLASSQFGIDVRRMFRAIARLPCYTKEFRQLRRQCAEKVTFLPCLHDWREEGGAAKNEYFWQDLYFARKVCAAAPKRHVDIGSRIDGFVAHVASFRQIEVFDIRPITARIPGVILRQADFMILPEDLEGYCDSLSCLHALEHFGLGRYGDPLDARGHESGLCNMAHILQPGGMFYLSVPLGRERIEFNAHRVFDPGTILDLAAVSGLHLIEFAVFRDGCIHVGSEPLCKTFQSIREAPYSLGLFTFVKRAQHDSKT